MVEKGPKRVWVKISDLLRATKLGRSKGQWSPTASWKKTCRMKDMTTKKVGKSGGIKIVFCNF